MSKIAIIANIAGQDGSYLAELLLKKGYTVHGIYHHRPANIVEIGCNVNGAMPAIHSEVQLHYYEGGNSLDIRTLLEFIRPDEIYNLAAMSHADSGAAVHPGSSSADTFSALRMLDAIRSSGMENQTRYFQALPSKLCGLVKGMTINEMATLSASHSTTVARVSDFWTVVNYRETFGMFACNGILFNHESPRRSESFVTRKISRGLANITQGLESCLYLGNLNALRDWGHARDYVKLQWLMLQQEKPEDFVIATGVQYTVRQFVTFAALELGIKLRFVGRGLEEKGVIAAIISPTAAALKVGDVIVAVDPSCIRHEDVCKVAADPTKARRKLGWIPETSLQDLVIEMVQADLRVAKERARLKLYG